MPSSNIDPPFNSRSTTTDRAAAVCDLWFRNDPADGSRDFEINFEVKWYGNPPSWTVSLREGNEDTAHWHRFYGHDLDAVLDDALDWCGDLLLLGGDDAE